MLVNLANAAITGETRKARLISLQDLRYRIQSGDRGQGYAIWRKEEFRRMVLRYAKRFSIMIGRFCACFFGLILKSLTADFLAFRIYY